MRFKLSISIIVLLVCITKSASKYETVSWNETKNLWQAEFDFNGKKQKFYFNTKFDASEKLNTLCAKIGMPPQKPEIYEIPNQQKKEKVSQYTSVYWHNKSKKWYVRTTLTGQKQIYGGMFKDELDAAKKVNELCKNFGVTQKNPSVSAVPNQQYQKKEKTSQYNGVYWKKQTRKWYVLISPKKQKQKYGGCFNNEDDAARRVNELCEDLRIPPQNSAITEITNQQYETIDKHNTSQYKGVFWDKRKRKLSLKGQKQKFCGYFINELDAAMKVNQLYKIKEKTSQYKGVSYDKQNRRWIARVCLKGQKQKYGGGFKNEVDAAKKVNELCENFGIPPQNLFINAIENQQYQVHNKTSKYIGVTWRKDCKKWYAQLKHKGQNYYGGNFDNEEHAAMKVNLLCDKYDMERKNSMIIMEPDEIQKKKGKTSQYKGVYWHKQTGKWLVQLRVKDGSKTFGGMFKDELDAGKRVNQLCKELGIPVKNLTISARPNQPYEKKDKTSQYKGVYWYKIRRKWRVKLYLKGQKQKYGGEFNDELDAAKKVNDLCKDLGIPQQNPTISAISNQQYEKYLLDHDDIQTEFEDLITILGEHNAPTSNIQENLFAAINYGEQAIMTEVNFCTKNGESALSIAAKHGFSNAVKFLISKGADKEHFTNDHHTPLSLAVSHNHLKVVQVLFEEWISPNSQETQYLHLSPMFNVKSREIAQLLIDNDAVTHEIYNDKNQSPLTVACQNGYLDVVEFFLDDGLDINHLDSDNKNPLFYALTNKHHDVANLLISKGAQNTFVSIN